MRNFFTGFFTILGGLLIVLILTVQNVNRTTLTLMGVMLAGSILSFALAAFIYYPPCVFRITASIGCMISAFISPVIKTEHTMRCRQLKDTCSGYREFFRELVIAYDKFEDVKETEREAKMGEEAK